ncbi:MAG: hypothetical protein LC104_03430 [Bacteroidales bacterium]|nr:hypothetical protein [Bacteroidales bacterium]
MSNLRAFIELALAKRQAQQPKLEAVQEHLRELNDQLGHLRRLAGEVTASEDSPHDLRQRAAALTSAIGGLDSQISDATARTANLLARFTKTTINIGVAGKARQGIGRPALHRGKEPHPAPQRRPVCRGRVLHRHRVPAGDRPRLLRVASLLPSPGQPRRLRAVPAAQATVRQA